MHCVNTFAYVLETFFVQGRGDDTHVCICM